MRQQLSLLFFVIASFPLSIQAAFEFVDVGARPVSLGGAFCAVSDDAHGPLHNPAGMCGSAARTVSLSACRLFGLAELDIQEMTLVGSFSGHGLGLWARRFGGHLYQEVTLGVGCSRQLWEGLSMGLCLRGLLLSIADHGSDETWNLDLGLLGAMNPRLRWGMAVHNLNNGRLGKEVGGVSQALSIGLACCPQENLLLSADLVEDITDISAEGSVLGKYPVELRLGCEGSVARSLAVRLGLQSRPLRFSGGLGLDAGPMHVDYACRSHQLLGPTHHLTISWR